MTEYRAIGCPRCGRSEQVLVQSRVDAMTFVCVDCGRDELFRDASRRPPIPPDQWPLDPSGLLDFAHAGHATPDLRRLVPPSPEGVQSLDEVVSAFGRGVAALGYAIQSEDVDLFKFAVLTMETAFTDLASRLRQSA